MRRFRLEYGWTTFWLVALLVFTATWSVQQADWADGLHILTPITILGLVLGLVLSQMRRIPPIVAHLIAFVVGVFVVLYQMTTFLNDTLGSRWDKLNWLWGRWESWSSTIVGGDQAEDLYLFILLMSGMLWVLGYAAVWFTFRSGWIWLTLLLPGAIVLLNLGYSRSVSTFVLVLYLFTALLLLMRFNFIQREETWRKRGVPYPQTLVIRGLWTAGYIAVLLILAGWMVPFSPQTNRALAAWESLSSPWETVETRFHEMFGDVLRGPGGSGGVGGFASFEDEFRLGGSLRLSEEPVVLVEGSSAPYLTAYRYDYFNGSGWESTVSETYEPDAENEDLAPPMVSFDADQAYPVPASSRTSTEEATHQVEVIRPQGSIVFSAGTLLKANIPTRAQTAWFDYENQQLLIDPAEEETTPPDLWDLVSLLKDADFTPTVEPTPESTSSPSAEATPASTPTADGAAQSLPTGLVNPDTLEGEARETYQEMRSLQANLAERDIQTEVVLNDDHQPISLIFSGRLPVFSDIEAVFTSEIGSGDTYEITSLQSNATTDELRAASTGYPVEITRRFLQVPNDHSERVARLAADITEEYDNPFDKATALESWLRENLTYSEKINLPPEGDDFIEHFIFESKEGYCTYYATSMTQMLRMVDIPARVAVGYFPADFDEDAGGYLYRDRNAHSWVEVYFPDYGWVSFEPTPARSPIQRTSAEDDNIAGSGALGEAGPGMYPEDRLDYFEEEFAPGEGGISGTLTTQEESTSTGQWIMRGIALLLVIAVGVASFFWLRGLRGLSPAGQFYTRLQRAASWTGVKSRASMTPFEYARSIASTIPGSRIDAQYLADLYVRERYGNRGLAAPELTRARAAWLRLRGLFLTYALLHRWRRRKDGDE